MGNASYFSLELHSAPLPVHPFPLPCTAVSIPFTEERQTLLTCLFAPVTALDVFWSLIYSTHFLVFHPGFFGRQSSFSTYLLRDDGITSFNPSSLPQHGFDSQCKCWMIKLTVSYFWHRSCHWSIWSLLYKRVTNSFCHLSSIFWAHFLAYS